MRVLLGAVVLLIVGFLLWPSPIASRAFEPGTPSPLPEALAGNRALEACERVSQGVVENSDKLLVESDGSIVAGDRHGAIHRLRPDGVGGYRHEILAQTDTRAMQVARAPDGNLIVADHHGSHIVIDSSGGVTRLPTLEDSPRGTAGAAVGPDGLLYYGAHLDAAPWPEQLGALLGALAAFTSELRSFDPRSGEVRTLIDGLYTPVGVALSSRGDFVAVAEFFGYRVTRYWLSGPKAGTSDRLIENLPWFPDGIVSDGDGTFYLALPGPRDPILDGLHPRPWLKDQFAKLVVLLVRLGVQPKPSGGLVLAIDERTGRILEAYGDPEGRVVDRVTDAAPHGGDLYLGSIAGDWIARCPIEAGAQPR